VKAENVGETAERAAADKMATRVIDSFQVVEVEENDREGRLRAAIAFDFKIDSFDEAPIVCEAGERIAFGQLANVIFGMLVCGGLGGEHHAGHGDDGHKRLQEKERSILRAPGEWTVSVDGAPGGDDCKYASCGGGFSAAETKRSPNEEGKTKILERIVFNDEMKAAAENKPGGEEQSES